MTSLDSTGVGEAYIQDVLDALGIGHLEVSGLTLVAKPGCIVVLQIEKVITGKELVDIAELVKKRRGSDG